LIAPEIIRIDFLLFSLALNKSLYKSDLSEIISFSLSRKCFSSFSVVASLQLFLSPPPPIRGNFYLIRSSQHAAASDKLAKTNERTNRGTIVGVGIGAVCVGNFSVGDVVIGVGGVGVVSAFLRRRNFFVVKSFFLDASFDLGFKVGVTTS